MMHSDSLSEWLDYIEAMHPKEIELGLARMQVMAEKLSVTSFAAKVVIVAGTNGKGSVIKALEEVYLTCGYKVAAYTSPHLLHFTERLRINGEALPEQKWVEAFNFVERERADQPLTFFEFTTLAALFLCQQTELEVVLLEVGLGGRLDAVNVVEPDISVITSVGIDHVDWLGDNREAIGYEKAGVFRTKGLAVCGDPHPPLSLLNVAREKQVKLYLYQSDYVAVEQAETWQFCYGSKCFSSLPKPTLALQNVATALMVTELLGLPVKPLALAQAMYAMKLPGRYEVIEQGSKIIFDVAHNAQAACQLAKRLAKESRGGKCYALISVREDKAFSDIIKPMLAQVDIWVSATNSSPIAQSAATVTKHLSQLGVECYTYNSVGSALSSILSMSSSEDLVLVFGSFYTVADAKRHLMLS